jgi:hypothetical protein
MADRLSPDQRLHENQSLDSNNGRYRVQYQIDGNFVLYDMNVNPPSAQWDSGTAGSAPGIVVLQTDGNFVIYDAANHSLWSLDPRFTLPIANATAVMRDDGNFVVYGVPANGNGTITAVFDAWSDERSPVRKAINDQRRLAAFVQCKAQYVPDNTNGLNFINDLLSENLVGAGVDWLKEAFGPHPGDTCWDILSPQQQADMARAIHQNNVENGGHILPGNAGN